METLVLAINPKIYEILYRNQDEMNEEVEWLTPQSVEDIDEIQRLIIQMSQTQTAHEPHHGSSP